MKTLRLLVLLALLLASTGVAFAQTTDTTTGRASSDDAGCTEGSYKCYDYGAVAVCQNGFYKEYGRDSDYYAKYCGAQTTPGNSCEASCKEAYPDDADRARFCMKAKCYDSELTCKDKCYLEYGRDGYQKCYQDRCEGATQPAPIEGCYDNCKREFGSDEQRTRFCVQAKCEGVNLNCKDRCYLGYGADGYQDCYRKQCETQGNEDFCGSSTYGACTTDADCTSGGCSGQVCQSRSEESRATTCEYRQCYNAGNYGLGCGCIKNQCQWARGVETKPVLPTTKPIEYGCEEKCKREYGKYPEKMEYCLKDCRGVRIDPTPPGNCQDGAVKVVVCSGGNWKPVFEQQPYCSGLLVPAMPSEKPLPTRANETAVSATGKAQIGETANARPVYQESNAKDCREGSYKCYPEEKVVAYCKGGQIVRNQDPSAFERTCGKRNFVQAVVSVFTGEKECKDGENRCYDESRKAEVCENGSWRGGGEDFYVKLCTPSTSPSATG